VVSAALISAAIASGYMTDKQKINFFMYQNTGVAMTTLATAWSKVSFAITLYRIIRNRYLKYFLWFVMITANLILIPGMMSIWIPACADPRKVFRPAYPTCMNHIKLQYLGGTTIGRIGSGTRGRKEMRTELADPSQYTAASSTSCSPCSPGSSSASCCWTRARSWA
jgi:hypothetical protein